jgi:hypothetical protein
MQSYLQSAGKAGCRFNDSRTQVFYLGLTQDNRIHIGGGPVDYVFNNGVQSQRMFKRILSGSAKNWAVFSRVLALSPSKWNGVA